MNEPQDIIFRRDTSLTLKSNCLPKYEENKNALWKREHHQKNLISHALLLIVLRVFYKTVSNLVFQCILFATQPLPECK